LIRLVEAAARTLAGRRREVAVPLPPGVEVRESRFFTALGGLLAGLGSPAAAVTLGRVILVHPEVVPEERLLRHELAHVAQWSQEPLVFPFRYIVAHLRYGYRANPYEAEARRAEQRSEPTGDSR
jgi:hypothetical protein